jgi:hypothetical protein
VLPFDGFVMRGRKKPLTIPPAAKAGLENEWG